MSIASYFLLEGLCNGEFFYQAPFISLDPRPDGVSARTLP